MPGAIAAMPRGRRGRARLPRRRAPGRCATRSRRALGLDPAQVLPGAGVDGLIRLMCLALLDPGDEIAMAWPSFLSWRLGAADPGRDASACAAARAPTAPTTSTRSPARVDPAHQARRGREPEQPDRRRRSAPAELRALPRRAAAARAARGRRGLLRVPAARAATTPPRWWPRAAPMAAMRTFSKAYGLAGLRVGYLLGPADAGARARRGAQRLRRERPRPGGGAREPRGRRRPPARADRAERRRARP